MSDVAVANTTSGLSGKTLLLADGDATVSGLHTFNRGSGSAPFAVNSGAANVSNLDADKLDGEEGSAYHNATNLNAGTVATARLGSGTASVETFLRGDSTWAAAFALLCQGRLTLTTGLPITTSDVTGAGTVYFTPYGGNRIALYDGTNWQLFTFAELSVALSSLVVGQAYDVFAYNNSGSVALETAEWANAAITVTIAAPGVVTWTGHSMSSYQSITFTTTGALPTGLSANTVYYVTVVDANTFKLSTSLVNVQAGTFITTTGSQSGTHTGHQPQLRQTAITLQNGVYVKSGTTTRRLLGSFLTTATNTTEDSAARRYLSNFYHRQRRTLKRVESTATWTWSTASWHFANASGSNLVECVVCAPELALDLAVAGYASNGGAVNVGTSIGEDISTAPSSAVVGGTAGLPATTNIPITGALRKYPTAGRHFYAWIELGGSSGTTTFSGHGVFVAGDDVGYVNGWIEG